MADFPELAHALRNSDPLTVLDVRRDDERATRGIAGSVHVPLQGLLDRLEELPAGTLWVHCASGFRASIASSLLHRAGRDVVHIDDEWAKAESSGVPIAHPHARPDAALAPVRRLRPVGTRADEKEVPGPHRVRGGA